MDSMDAAEGAGLREFFADNEQALQDLPPRSYSGDDTVAWLKDALLTLRLEGAAADVAAVGLSWQPRYVRPTLWTDPSPARSAIEPLLPQCLAGGDDSGEGAEAAAALGFREVALDLSEDIADRLALARRPMAARQGTREFVRGRIGSMPFTPGGAAWDAGGDSAPAAAAAEAASGAWLAELDSGKLERLRAAAPGMKRGLFGAWAADAAQAGADGVAADEQLAAEVQAAEQQAADDAEQHQEQQQEQQQQQGPQKVSLDDLFSGVWMLQGDHAAAAEQGGEAAEAGAADQGWDAAAAREEQQQEEQQQAAAATATLAAATARHGTTAAVTGGARAAATPADLLQGLPDDDQLPGGVEVDAVAAVLGAEAAVADWALKPASEDHGFAALGARPIKRRRGDQEWALSGHIPNLAKRWEAAKAGLAKSWPFELDVFQKEAILHMEDGRSVFVAAHTSAGKTVAAEYAFALAAKHCTRAVYTSPIKTISNQKFRDFSSQFEVGLLTGDVSIRPESACLIMTTEILRSMLYKGAELIRDIEWVVFDEVHYVNDAERGVVWEEVIIMLPAHVNLILLSATVPNVMEFADWVGRTKQKHIHVTGTTKRPVPLQHSLYYAGQMFTICQAETYNMQGFRAAREAAKAKAGPVPQTKAAAQRALPTGRGDGGGRGGGRGGGGGQQQQQRYGQRGSANAGAAAMAAANRQGGGGGGQLRSERSQWLALIETLRKGELLPCVVFVFSKKRIDALADNLQSLDMTSAAEKSEIHVFCDKALARLKGTDRELPQVLRVREMLKRGLGVHHAGLLPIVKEIVEMLFCRGVIKVLFSTETFAMGVNAPARTVIFQSLRKHDGKSFRPLLPGEYTQMAGRAGRRGLDTVGTVVIACWDELPEEVDVKRMMMGAATRLESQFRLTYSMILNLLRVEDLKVEDMLKRSFAEFRSQRAQPELLEALEKGQAALARLRSRPWPVSPLATSREEMERYCRLSMDIEGLDARLQAEVMSTRAAQQALAEGRVVLLRVGGSSGSGITELGVICGDSSSTTSGTAAASNSGTAGGTAGGGRGLDDLLGSRRSGVGGGLGFGLGGPQATAGDGFGGGGSTGSSAAGGRQYVMLYLHRPSPLDALTPAAATAAAPAAAVVGGGSGAGVAAPAGGSPAMGGRGVLGDPPLMQLKKKDDDDDLLMMGMGGGGGGKKGKKGGGGGGGRAQPLSLAALGGGGRAAAVARQPVALPHAGEVGGAAYRLEPVASADLVAICKVKIRVDSEAVLGGDPAALAAAVTALVRVAEDAAAQGGDPPALDPVADLKLNSLDLVGDFRLRAQLAAERAAMPCHRDPLLPEMFAVARSERLLATRLAGVARRLSNASLAQLPEYRQRVKVLQRMGYLERDQSVTMKGRVACEVNSGDELVATELIFSGLLADLQPEEAVALLSALVFQEKNASEPELTPELAAARDSTVSLALQAGLVQQQAGLQLTPEEFATSTLKFGLAEVVYEWARGTPFQQICGLTDVMEGSIVRAMVRLDETCREFRDAARVMGNTALFQQMEAASAAIKRDVIFAASLYLA
ncbi:hypothetical protein D9Q98_006998 [Chlorella vulgaris]|uniref:Uncharacterized protein n=1 Tax=Chlorella vulgaris TaxID=3077 RepID=A0A9D4TJ81_CHLVU|nr:hypothetical protein D9Q98_006998 [Chlorella vulgaris]